MRKDYIDNLRWIGILLLVPYHAAMAWNVWGGEPNYIYFKSNPLISSIVVFLSPYFMPAMFLISGISARSALEKRTVWQFVIERFKKLLIPLFWGTVLLMPWMGYLADRFNYNYKGGVFRHSIIFFTRFTDFTGSDGGFSLGQFWFLAYLFVISMLAVGIICVQRNILSEKIIPEKIMLEKKNGFPLIGICFLGLPLPFLSSLLSVSGKSLAEFTYIFLTGYYLFSKDAVISKIEKYKWFFLCIGLTATVIHVDLVVWPARQNAHVLLPAKCTSEWFMCIALLGIGKRYLNAAGKIAGFMSQRSYSFYIFHYIWVVLFQSACYPVCGNHTLLLFVLPVILAYGATFLCCEIRRIMDQGLFVL